MPLLQVENLNKFYGAVPVLRDVQLTIQPGEKWGLAGRNGCGKTTLIRILTGEEDFDGGAIHWAQNTRIGYLKQEPVFQTGLSIYQELRSNFQELDDLQARIAGFQQRMSQPNLSPAELQMLVEEHHNLTEQFELRGGYQIEGRIQGVLRGLGFPKERWEDSTAVLSGGERTRLALAKILLTGNDILFLDEPTNYLDLSAIEWLEGFLADYQGAVLLISHDRYFLDRIVTGLYEIEFCKIKRYKGNYTEYRRQKEAEYQTALKAYQQQEKELSRLEKFVRESRATEKSKRRAHSVEKRLSRIERLEKPLQNKNHIKMRFQDPVASGRLVLELENVAKSFGGKTLFKDIQLKIEAGEKVGLIGPNGAGKTTLLKIILGREQSDQGRVRLGYEVYPAYFSQLTNEDEMTGTPFSQIMEAADLDNTEARTILGRFLFRGDDVFKSVADLSGGERRRLGLIKLLLSKSNFLILDEPTNHLDLDSIEVMERALADYAGTLLIVSHDRSFLNEVVDRYLAIIGGTLQSFPSYQAYWEYCQTMNGNTSDEQAKSRSAAQVYREQNKEAQRDLKRKQRNLLKIEADINSMETRKNELLVMLNDIAVQTDYLKSMEYGNELAKLEEKLSELYRQWEELQLAMES
ncbi:MAG: ABC-F family ATP-binding cassette domain-containing protein [Bacillota bacterium]